MSYDLCLCRVINVKDTSDIANQFIDVQGGNCSPIQREIYSIQHLKKRLKERI